MIRHDLLATILTTDDDSARLVFADWLEEQGELPRATFIRLQCELVHLARWDRRAVPATWEVDALLGQHGATWRAELPALDGVEWTEFARGFAKAVRVADVETLYRHAAAIAAAAPVSCVELKKLDEHATPYPEEGVPWLTVLRLVDDREYHVHPTRSVLAAARELEIVELEQNQELDWLDFKPGKTKLVRLDVKGQHTVGLAFTQALCAAPWSSSIERLGLGTAFVDWNSGYYNDPTLRAEGARVLAETSFTQLVRLNVDRQRLGAEGLAAVVESLPNLRELEARSCDATTVTFLAASPGTPIVRLGLSENAFGDAGATVIATAPRLATLESLSLEMCEIGGPGLVALTRSPAWSTLRELDLGKNPLGLDGVLALSEAADPTHLHTLRIPDIDLTADIANVLATIPWLRSLLVIDLAGNELLGSTPLLDALAAGSVQHVNLAKTQIATLGALAPLWERVNHLDLGGNPFGDAGLDALITAEPSALHALDLRDTKLTPHGITVLTARARCPRLRTLVLSGNALDADAVARIAASPLLDHLEVLELANCGLSDEIVPMLAAAPRLGRLRLLNLHDNDLAPESLLAIAALDSLRGIKRIQLTGDPWSLEDEQRELLLERFGPGWWYEEVQQEMPEWLRARQ